MGKKTSKNLKPGTFVYAGATVFEVDNNGRKRAREDLVPGYKGPYKNKFYKPPVKRAKKARRK